MREPFRGAGSEILNDIYGHAADVLVHQPELSKTSASKISREIVDRLRSIFGGQLLYFPKGVQGDLTERDEIMLSEFNGKNHKDLAKKYGLSLQQVYRRLRQNKC
ncbi:MAG: DNA-binding protein [Candidatus Thiodiazotropha sp. (ex Lucinoma kastoroae)]|nr:DNA-binding protein [Candidatus Thiodiazotropha sp. (ex Lucinoma kastoroae)]